MQDMLGWYRVPVDQETTADFLKRFQDRSGRPDSVRAVIGERAGCVGPKASLYQSSDGSITTVVSGRPYWTNRRYAQMATDNGMAQSVAEAYRADPEGFLGDLRGSFVLAVIDVNAQSVMLALDRIGQRHLFYAVTPAGLVFGTRADDLVRHPGVNTELSLQALFDYVYFHHCPSPGSIYTKVNKLEGGECLVWRDGSVSRRYYWLPEFREDSDATVEREGTKLLELLTEAVRRETHGASKIGAFLSGGLDSSTVSGLLARESEGEADTFSIGFPVQGYDEIAYARIAARHFNTRQHEYYLTPADAVTAIPLVAAACDEPFGNSSALPAYFCAKLAREHGVDRLLGGDGGDELFAGNERYAKQLLFEYFWEVPSPLRKTFESALNRIPPALQKGIVRKAGRYVEQAGTPLPDRLQDYNFLHRHDVNEIFHPDLLASIDVGAPLSIQQACYRRPKEASPLNRMLYLDWKITLHDNDLVKVNRMCELAGVEVAYPMLDDAVIELSCRIPSKTKLKANNLRWFYKRAMHGFLPAEIINKSKHGFGLPFGIWLQNHEELKALAYGSIQQLKGRGYFRAEFLDHAIAMHQSVHAAYYGELIWVLMMLEQWFQTHAIR